jgi:hypothetical protein
VADPRVYHPDAWLTADQLPYGGAAAWRLVGSGTSAAYRVDPLSSSCGRYDQGSILDPNTAPGPFPSGELSELFARKSSGDTRYVTETQWFYPEAGAAAGAFAWYVDAFDACVRTAGTTPPLSGQQPVTHTVRRTVTGPAAGAWVHLVRYRDGSPASGGYGPTAHSDNHEYAVVRGNVLAVLVFGTNGTNSSVFDDASPDAALVGRIATELGAYDRPPGKWVLPWDPQTDFWQTWPSAARLPITTPGGQWSYRGSSSVGYSQPGQAGALGNVACTDVTPDMPVNDPVLTGHRARTYQEFPAHPTVSEVGAAAQVDLFFFTSPQAATAGYAKLLADLRSCQQRLRPAQAKADVAQDAAVAEVASADGVAAWTVTGSGLFSEFPGMIDGTAPHRQRTVHLVLLVVRGPLLESIGVVTAPAKAASFTRAAALATATEAATNLCRYDIGC